MKALDSKVNIVPIIAKSDTTTQSELHKFKAKVSEQMNKFIVNFKILMLCTIFIT